MPVKFYVITSYAEREAAVKTYLGPVGHVPAWLTSSSLTLLFGSGLVIKLTIFFADDRQDSTELLHADDVTLDHAVTASHGTLHNSQLYRDENGYLN